MCIIAIYHKGEKPDGKTLRRMIAANGDGVGLAWNTGANVYWRKGLKTAEEVEAILKNRKYNDLVFHARIATSGGVSALKCHPFPLTTDPRKIDGATAGKTKGALVFHNGILGITPENGRNDTQEFILKVLAPLYDRRKVEPYRSALKMSIDGSRLAIITPKGVEIAGVGWKEDGGVLYSNEGFKERSWRSWWKDCDGESDGGLPAGYRWKWNADLKDWEVVAK